MLFRVDKCKVMHNGYNNRKMKYEMESKIVEVMTEERDFGDIMQSNSKWTKYKSSENCEYSFRLCLRDPSVN
jgi:hypothetical protein